MVTPPKTVAELEIVAGHPALDFANTNDGLRDMAPDVDYLVDYGALLTWAERAEVVDSATVRSIRGAARRDVHGADAALARAVRLRTAVYAIFRAVAEGGNAAPAHVAQVQCAHQEALAEAQLGPAGPGAPWTWTLASTSLDRIAQTVALAAIDLLRSPALDRVGLCAECRWLFLDTSRNHSRRWCSMQECGTKLSSRRWRSRRATAES